jgi:SH3-like domain-containing protein
MTRALPRLARIAPALLLALAFGAQAQQMVSIGRDTVNMRAGASTRHEVLYELSKGYPLQVTGRQGDWLKVRDFEGDVGWVHQPMTGRTPHHVVKANVANIRSAPNTRAAIVGKAERGEVLRTVEKRPDWVKVKQEDGAQGWVAKRLLWGW